MDDRVDLYELAESFNDMFRHRQARSNSAAQKRYRASLGDATRLIRTVLANGNFRECLDVIDYIQGFDMEFLALTDADRENIAKSQVNLAHGRHYYELLANNPSQYRDHAKGYVPRDRIGGLPNDGMQKALKSHLGYLRERRSIMLAAEERDFLQAQEELAVRMMELYRESQREAIRETGTAVGR